MAPRADRGNYVAEWYGFRVNPPIDDSNAAKQHQAARTCPFLSAATGAIEACIKPNGVCTISSDSNGRRQDWPVCPNRILDQHFTLLGSVVKRMYNLASGQEIVLRPTIALQKYDSRQEIMQALIGGTPAFVFFHQNFGGEMNIRGTAGSPAFKIDASIVELLGDEERSFRLGQHLFFELQTADFHGNYRDAVGMLDDILREYPDAYHYELRERRPPPVKGPNKANIFKRTIYQTIFKMQLSRDSDCAGFAIALPESVWDSWHSFLGDPTLQQDADDPSVWHLGGGRVTTSHGGIIVPEEAWIFVFDTNRASTESPKPLKIVKQIKTSSAALIHYALEESPRRALAEKVLADYKRELEGKIRENWPPGGLF